LAAGKRGEDAQASPRRTHHERLLHPPRSGSPANAIFYRDVPLWDTIAASLDRYEFFLAERDYAWGDRWELICRDDCGDYFSYGKWTTLAAALSWLHNPEP
jgi:hypothetical protein